MIADMNYKRKKEKKNVPQPKTSPNEETISILEKIILISNLGKYCKL